MVPRKGVENAVRGFGRLVKKHGVIAARILVVGGELNEPDPRPRPK